MAQAIVHHPSSYRDPSGFIFEKEGILYRQVNTSFKENFDHFIESGCYNHLVEQGLVISHEPINENLTGDSNYYHTLRPEKIPFIFYPYEWSFDMLKDAALLTLRLIKESLHYGMLLKDATPFNIQWHKGKLVFIDTLSFEKYKEVPWAGYRQFCENFLGPLLVMHYAKTPLSQLMLAWPDGIPIAIVKSLLPKRSRFSLHTYLHVHLHAKIASKKQNSNGQVKVFSKQKLLNLVASLELLIGKLSINDQQSAWSGYYEEASRRDSYLEDKKRIIVEWVQELHPVLKTAADLGANEGVFSTLLAEKNILTLATDYDPFCINRLYMSIKKNGQHYIQPLIIDLAKPSPAIGVNNEEWNSFLNRTNVDISLALALIHHLAIGKSIPFNKISELFSRITRYLIIEFVPLEDEKVRFMLSQRAIDTANYTQHGFESSFNLHFTIEKKNNIAGSHRILYLMKKR